MFNEPVCKFLPFSILIFGENYAYKFRNCILYTRTPVFIKTRLWDPLKFHWLAYNFNKRNLTYLKSK